MSFQSSQIRKTSKSVFILTFLLLLINNSLFTNSAIGKPSKKLFIAVLDLDLGGGVPESYRQPLSDRLRQELFKTGRFTLVERNQMETILEQQRFQMSGCTSDECAVEAGKLLGVERIVAGSISKVASLHTISLRMINIETGAMMRGENVDCVCTIEEVLTTRIQEAALRMAGLGGTTTTQRTTTPTGAAKGDVFIKSDPPGATVYLNEKTMQGVTPLSIEQVTAGLYSIRLVKGDYVGEEEFFIEPDIINRVDVVLELGQASLRVSSAPYEAVLFIDGEEIGPTPQSVADLTAGNHEIKLSLSGYNDYKETVRLKVGETNRINATLVMKTVLNVTSSPTGANIFINDISWGTTPVTLDDIKPGTTLITAKLKDYHTWHDTIRIEEGAKKSINATMQPAFKGAISFAALPEGTSVELNGMVLGVTPLDDEKLGVGSYSFKLNRPGYEGGSKKVTVKKNTRTKLTYNFKAKSKSMAIIRSAIWPGLGQMYADRKAPGWIYAIGEAAVAGFLFSSISDYNGKVADYRDAGDQASAISTYDDAESAKSTVTLAAVLTFGLYFWNITDAYLFSDLEGSTDDSSIGFNLTPMNNGGTQTAVGVSLCIPLDFNGRAVK
ncbi:MAG: PEGA domain-containing protein [Candidatus Electryonea clarkiae]|nr:PEGA domain-containing protein [Candidatus Electryonea clarkiae]MDP8289225.1 PEGA domain-containing protein [Candidatus Electryonea clarkiae]